MVLNKICNLVKVITPKVYFQIYKAAAFLLTHLTAYIKTNLSPDTSSYFEFHTLPEPICSALEWGVGVVFISELR